MKRKKMTLTEELNQMSRLFAAMGHKVVLKEATTGPGGPGKSTALTALDGTTALAKYIGAETVAEMEQSLLTAARNSDAIVQKLGGKTDFSFDDLTSAGFGSTKSEIGESIIKNLEKQAAENLSTTLANYIGTKNKTESSVLMTKNALSNDVKLSIKSLSDNLDVLDVAAMSLIPTTITKLRNLSDDITETTLQTQLRDLLDGAEAQVNTKKLPDVSEGGGTTIKDIDYDNPLVTKDNLKNIVSENITSIKMYFTNIGQNITDSMVNNAIDLLDKMGIKNVDTFYNDYEIAFAGAGFRNTSGPGADDIDPSNLFSQRTYEMSGGGGGSNGFQRFKKEAGDIGDYWMGVAPGQKKRSRATQVTLIVLTITILITLYNLDWEYWTGKVVDKTKDVVNDVTTDDAPDVDCVQDVTGYNKLPENFQNFVAREYGCQYTNRDADPKVEGFEIINNVLFVYFDGGCIEKYAERTPGQFNKVAGSGDCKTPPQEEQQIEFDTIQQQQPIEGGGNNNNNNNNSDSQIDLEDPDGYKGVIKLN